MNLQDRYIAALVAYGFLRSDNQPRLHNSKPYSRKYVRMHKPNSPTVFWIGRAGAVRRGHTVSASISMSEDWKVRLLEGKLRSSLVASPMLPDFTEQDRWL